MSKKHEGPVSVHQALIYAMVLIAGSDREMNNAELTQIGRLAQQLPIFAGYDANQLTDTARECAVLVHTRDGVDRVLAIIVASLPPRLRATCYLCATELAAVDGRVPVEELRLLQRLRQALELDRLTSVAIERVTQARLATA
jgi:tellurite resistance protein